MTKRAVITGITGQDGSYLAEFLLGKGYEVWGLIRRSSSFNTGRIDHLYVDPHEEPRLRLVYGDMTDGSNLAAITNEIKPDEVYNLVVSARNNETYASARRSRVHEKSSGPQLE